ncbi:hypothetical protein AYL99_08640 [Fonsecaea erecta]|uniref:Uncharacterized protein n=1 Tax=Fonsecaea erecta TaxID=1367422 RepID=A0A178ZE15_9EURO|nr:hypothetical protein AYL99_08640 [Fonsecaea erecta]OAP57902.1 hypothetical protein AYL99_08640 [Fonsecaea erecta]
MDEYNKDRDPIEHGGRSFSANISASGNHGMTEPQPQRAGKRKMAVTDTAGLTRNQRVELAGNDIDTACVQFEEKMSTRGYRPFVDRSGFVYLLTFVRKDILKNRLKKHRIKVRYAPHFSSQHENKCSEKHPVDEGDRPVPEKVKVFRPCEDPESNSRLPPCPVPMYFFPKPFPYSRNPVIESSLPRHLRPSNSKLRVRIPDPWAFSLQLFESDTATARRRSTGHISSVAGRRKAASCQDMRSYACYSIDTRAGQLYVQTLAPSGSTFDLAWDMFCNFFRKRVGIDWKNIHEEWKNGIHREGPLSENPRGKDGTDDGVFLKISKPRQSQYRDEEDEGAVDSFGTRSRKPIVTVLINSHEHLMDEQLEVQAKTPESGW